MEKQEDAALMKAMDEIYTRCPFYGKRKMKKELRNRGFEIGIKHTCSLMKKMGLQSIYTAPKTSIPHPLHRKYPYLLRGVSICRINQVWGADITFIRLLTGWVYLVAIIDWYSRYVIAFRLSNTMEKEFCVQALLEGLGKATPECFNSDQGCQFTSYEFTDILEQRSVKISMDGRGRCLDNIFTERLWRTVKYEEVYLKNYASLQEAHQSLSLYFRFYNNERLHQALNYKTPAQVYFQTLS